MISAFESIIKEVYFTGINLFINASDYDTDIAL